MRKIVFCLIFSIFLPHSAAAQPITVQSGDHRGFTRLVFSLPNGTDWQVSHQGSSVNLTYKKFDQGFDLSRVFDPISRDRISSITSLENQVSLTLACECRVSAFLERNRYVVIDVASPNVQLQTPLIARSKEAVNLPLAKAEPKEDPILNPLPFPTTLQRGKTRARTTRVLPGSSFPVHLPRGNLSKAEQAVLDDVQERLAKEVGIAATRGMLTANPTARRPRQIPGLDPIEVPEMVDSEPMAQDAPNGLVNNMRITSSMDLPGRKTSTGSAQSISGLICPGDELLDFADWNNDLPISEQIGTLRQRLYGEFDKLDHQVALNLAKLYLYFGFGAEAKHLLTQLEIPRKETELLISIAEIIDFGQTVTETNISEMIDCSTDVALWAILAKPNLDVSGEIDPDPALLALNKLPEHLRSFLAPMLSQRLRSHGDADAAATALRNLERLPQTLPAAAQLAKAEIAIAEGEVSSGTSQLAQVIEGNTESSPEALIALVEAKLDQGLAIAPETAELVQAFAEELQNTSLGPKLRRTHVLALIRSGQFDAAQSAIAELGGGSEKGSETKLRALFLTELTTAAEDVVFLDHFFAHAREDTNELASKEKTRLAARLMDLGFAEAAQAVITTILDRPKTTERQILAARAALALGQPFQAQAELIGIDVAEAEPLRAMAKEMAGAHREAHDIYLRSGQEAAATDAAWLAPEWRELVSSETPIFGQLASLENPPPFQLEAEGMLARTAETLSESEAARATLTEALSAAPLASN
ncbi:hypothetical protein JQT66_01255 [Sulfitobacter mediterraneus]|uniref:hypothetical protein n=1 Tax=Sulfitobacter mediterraneus TaxID=83219 RepID=UPI0019343B63|nr:hypothetical protein [Sulfitobacter mediterraneus]MBM1308787.1 hypothetical protein [Sulfitobacter mediterraneus]MBM1312672.1 hypothetical protein [Sulfitobacter mediterraneus]MBM1321054.1 hypothetical protein [Sulfitobacter mediterraneus]MBM1324941.1 hypothetical protein [Sulfitobacter mediterraneus]MBM1396288.1 hypothetical protein [Sulfitobacter mediterraneus]